jgi:hypothetical protein
LVAGVAWAATNWLTPGSGQGLSTSTSLSEQVNSACNSSTTGTSCGTSNILPTSGSSATATAKNTGVAATDEALTAASCSAATVTDTDATPTVVHGDFTAASYQVSGPLSGDAVSFDGSTTWLSTGGGSVIGPQTFTLLAWFKTSAASPGPILNFADAQSPSATNHHDRSLWIDASGDLVAGSAPNSNLEEAVGSTAVNNGAWHFAAVTDSATSLTLYLVGSQQASNSSGAGAQNYDGWWSVGGGKLSGWSNTPTLNGSGAAYFNGSLAGVAVIPSALTSTQISTLHSEASYAAYASAVAAYSPSHYWGLQDAAPTPATGSTATLPGQETAAFADLSSNANTATPYGGVETASSGPLGAGGAATFDGNSGYLETANSATAPQTFTQLAWFKTSGGVSNGQMVISLIDNQVPALHGAQDRAVWINPSGTVTAYVYPGSSQSITTSAGYANGSWHLLAVTPFLIRIRPLHRRDPAGVEFRCHVGPDLQHRLLGDGQRRQWGGHGRIPVGGGGPPDRTHIHPDLLPLQLLHLLGLHHHGAGRQPDLLLAPDVGNPGLPRRLG